MVELHYRERPLCQEVNPPRYRERIGSDLIEKLGLDRKNLPGTVSRCPYFLVNSSAWV